MQFLTNTYFIIIISVFLYGITFILKSICIYLDNSIDSWLFINSPWPICIILIVYLTFVLKVGPKLMETREPINIKYILLFYNFMQTMFNSYILTNVSSYM